MTAETMVQYEDQVPKTMVDALDADDPLQALLALSQHSQQRAKRLSKELSGELEHFQVELPELLNRLPNSKEVESHPVATAIACSDSILHSLTKIASGGSQASLEIRSLEQEKRELEEHAQDVETALILRKSSDLAAQSLSAERLDKAAQAIRDYTSQVEFNRLTDRAKAYAGEYTVTQLESTQKALKDTLLGKYQEAVQAADIMKLGRLTPLVQMVHMEQEAVSLYLRFLKGILSKELQKAATVEEVDRKKPPYVPMARVYNSAVTILRHHLPMVSHCLHRADGDAAVVQLVHVQVEQAVEPLFQKYISSRQLSTTSQHAQRIYELLEERYSGRGDFEGHDESDELDDFGFSSQVGTLADVDSAMEEAALCLQHAESYTRFINHTVREVNKARALRHQTTREQRRAERERQNWATGMSAPIQEEEGEKYEPLEILPAHTKLQEIVAEVGGYYSVIERCLLLASMQRAFSVPEDDPRQYSPLGMKGNSSHVASRAMQTSIVEACLYSARRGSQRAFATGHTGTASAVANNCSDCLRVVLVEHLSSRAEDIGVSALKPGEGLLAGAAGIFNVGQTMSHAVGGAKVDDVARKREIEQGITWACASLNDLDVAALHTQELEKILLEGVEKGFPPNTHETEQLRMCVKSFSPVAEIFKMASNNAIESLVSVLKSRIRAIVTDAVGDGTGPAAFNVMGGGKTADRHTVRMNYELDEEAYQLLEVSEGYISRLCTCLDDLILPLCSHLGPRLSDALILEVLGTVSKRLEASLKKVRLLLLCFIQ